MSILFKGNLEEGNYTLIKTIDGWVLKGETSYVGFNFAEPKTGVCSGCKCLGSYESDFPCVNCVRITKDYYCGADMRGEEE